MLFRIGHHGIVAYGGQGWWKVPNIVCYICFCWTEVRNSKNSNVWHMKDGSLVKQNIAANKIYVLWWYNMNVQMKWFRMSLITRIGFESLCELGEPTLVLVEFGVRVRLAYFSRHWSVPIHSSPCRLFVCNDVRLSNCLTANCDGHVDCWVAPPASSLLWNLSGP